MTGNIIGIDPGLSGAIAVLSEDGEILAIEDMPTFEIVRNKRRKREINTAMIAEIIARHRGNASRAVVEKVGAMPGQGVTSMFAFGKSAGVVLGVIAANRIALQEVTPRSWKKKMQLAQGKGAARKRASELWPESAELFARVKDDGRAEAALIAECGRRGAA